jgi:hypothetical protein
VDALSLSFDKLTVNERMTARVVYLDAPGPPPPAPARQGPYTEDATAAPAALLTTCPRCLSDLIGGRCDFCEWRAPR